MRTIRTVFLFFVVLCIGCDIDNAEKPHNTKLKFFKTDKVQTVVLQTLYENPWDSLAYFKKRLDVKEKSTYIKAKLTINDSLIGDVGIRLKGESSYDFYPGKKKSIKIKFNHYDKSIDFKGLKKLNLNNNFKDPTMIREIMYLKALKHFKLPAQKCSFTHVYLNKEYLGIYLALEQIDKRFIKRNFKNDKGFLFKGEPRAFLTYPDTILFNYLGRYNSKEDLVNYSSLLEVLKQLNSFEKTEISDQQYVDSVSRYINIDKWLKNWAINNMLVNIDAFNMQYAHNYYMYYDSVQNNLNWISYDGNYAFGAWSPNLNFKQMIELSPLYFVKNRKQSDLLNYWLVENSLLRKRYLDVYENEVLALLSDEKYLSRIYKYKDLIRDGVKQDSLKMYSYHNFKDNFNHNLGDIKDPGAFIPGINPFIEKRRAFLLAFFKSNYNK